MNNAYGKGDLNTVRQIFAPDIRWRIPGSASQQLPKITNGKLSKQVIQVENLNKN